MAKGRLGRSVSVIGVGYSPLGNVAKSPEILHWTERELASYAALEAMEDAGIEAKNIDIFDIGMSGPNFESNMKSAAPHFSDWFGMHGKPAIFHDEGCGSFLGGLHQAVMAVASGVYDCSLSVGVNILFTQPKKNYPGFVRRPMPREELYENTWTDFDSAYEKPGTGGADTLDEYIGDYLRRYNITLDQLDDGLIRYAQHERRNANTNPKKLTPKISWADEAKQFGFDDISAYLKSPKFNPMMGSTLRGKWMSLWSDGAAAVIVCATEKVAELCSQSQPIQLAGIGMTTLLGKDLVDFPIKADVDAARRAYDMAGITDPYREIEYVELMDCPMYNVIRFGEASGYIPEGKTVEYMTQGNFELDGDRPLNASGGHTQLAHPSGACNGISFAEAVYQMRGEAGDHQIARQPNTAVVSGGGGGSTDVVIVLKK